MIFMGKLWIVGLLWSQRLVLETSLSRIQRRVFVYIVDDSDLNSW